VLSSEGAGHRIAVIGVAIVADDLGTERGGGVHLHDGRVAGYHHGHCCRQQSPGQSQGLSVVAG